MFPFCLCTAHVHGCRTDYEQKLVTPKTRIIMPLMEPLYSHYSCQHVASNDANMLKTAFELFTKNEKLFHKVHILESVNLRLK